MNQLEQRLIFFFLIILLLIFPTTLIAKERRDANVKIFKKKPKMEGTPWEKPDLKGELIAVKENSLLLLDSKGIDVSVDVADIREIKIVRKSGAKIGSGIGFITGVIVSIPLMKGFSELDDGTVTTGEYVRLEHY